MEAVRHKLEMLHEDNTLVWIKYKCFTCGKLNQTVNIRIGGSNRNVHIFLLFTINKSNMASHKMIQSFSTEMKIQYG